MITEIQTPGLMVFGDGALGRLGDVLAKVGMTHPLVVTDRGLVKTPVFPLVTGALEAADISYGVFSDTVPDPELPHVEAGAAAFRAGAYDGFIGLGGGSAMDTAKAINLLLHSGGDISAWRVPKAPAMKVLPLVCIPTTAGTGSEVTRGIVVTDPDTHEKMVFMGLACVPSAAVIDPALTAGLPFRVAADTGLDALTHAMEAYVSRKRNPHSDVLALSAMRLIGGNIVEACTARTAGAREAMMLAAAQAGIGFSNASVGLVHGMSRPIGSFFGMPHGTSNAVLLCAVTGFSIPAAPERYADCARAIGFANGTDNTDAACERLLRGLAGMARELKVPTLSEFGVAHDDYFARIPLMAEQALASGSPNNNPRLASVDEIAVIYEQIWS